MSKIHFGNARFLHRTDNAENWESINPVLLKGELGIEAGEETKIKIGDGVTPWNSLPYFADFKKYIDGKLAELKEELTGAE